LRLRPAIVTEFEVTARLEAVADPRFEIEAVILPKEAETAFIDEAISC
jgi:hypothetical protein